LLGEVDGGKNDRGVIIKREILSLTGPLFYSNCGIGPIAINDDESDKIRQFR
jgi:hypothetical protein